MNKFIERLKYIRCTDIKHIFIFIAAVPVSVFFRIKHKNLWLICENGTTARDNGYWLFKYIREKHSEIDIAYAITNNSPDLYKVKNMGKIIPFASFLYWVYYLSATKIILTAKLGKPSPALCFMLEQFSLIRSKQIFLQHGITKDDMKSLYHNVCRFSLFVTSVQREYDFIENTFGYKNLGIVKMLGFCRFDNLLNFKSVYKENQILLMPTWRDWLGSAALNTTASDFMQSEYFKVYQSFLTNKRLLDMLRQKNIQLIFYPHSAMQKFISAFKTDGNFVLIADWHKYDIQQLLMESALCITDYSSIAMDFAYMEKPLLYYQFDYEHFRQAHYSEGYFSYENDGFGEIAKDENVLIELLESYINSDFAMKEKYAVRVHDFFTLHDCNNCERNFQAIRDL